MSEDELSVSVAMVALPALPASPPLYEQPRPFIVPVLGDGDGSVKVEAEESVASVVAGMELPPGVFDTRHGDNTDVLLALLTQNKELEGKFVKVF